MAMKMRIFLLLMLMPVDVRAPYDVKIKIASTPASRIRRGIWWRIVGSIEWGGGSNTLVRQSGYINVHHPLTRDIGEVREFYAKVFYPNNWLVAEWADVYHYQRKKIYRFQLRRISGSENCVARFYNPTARKLCTNQCKPGVTWAHPSCNCTVCTDSNMFFYAYTGRCAYMMGVKVKTSLCGESRVNNRLYIGYVGNNSRPNIFAITRPNTKKLIEVAGLSVYHRGIVSALSIQLSDSEDWLEAEWADVYDFYKRVIYRFVLRKITGKEGGVMFTNPLTRGLEISEQPPAVVMCQLQSKYLWRKRQSPEEPTYQNTYPCTHIVFRSDRAVTFVNDMDTNNNYDNDYNHLLTRLRALAAIIDQKKKVLAHFKVDNFQFDVDDVVNVLKMKLMPRKHLDTNRSLCDGIELDISHSQYLNIHDNRSLTQLLKAMREMLDDEPTQNELSVKVNSKNTELYDIEILSKYADYVVVNAVVDEWPGHSPNDMSTVSPSSLCKANTGGESQRQSVARWVDAGLPREKIILPFTTYAWNTRYCLKGKPCKEYYNKSVPVSEQFRYNEEDEVYQIPFYYLSAMGHKDWMDTEPYNKMNTGPGVPFENQQTVLERMNFIKSWGLRGTKVMDIMWDTDNFTLTSIAYRELVDRGGNSVDPAATSDNGGPGAGTGGLSALLVTTIICVHLYVGIELHHVMM